MAGFPSLEIDSVFKNVIKRRDDPFPKILFMSIFSETSQVNKKAAPSEAFYMLGYAVKRS